MKLNENHIHRLSFSKFIFGEGEKHCNLTSPNNSIAILHMHDSVDIYIQLLCELYDKKPQKSNPALIDLINSLNTKLQELDLDKINVPFFNRLNIARNRLKHESMFSTKIDVLGIVNGIKDFYQHYTPIYFDGLDYNSISLIDLVVSAAVKKSLKTAKRLIDSSDFKNSLVEINKAFGYILNDFTTIQTDNDYRERIVPSSWFRSISQSHRMQGDDLGIRGFRDFEEELKKSFDTLSELIVITNLGIDFQDYARFEKYRLFGYMTTETEYTVIGDYRDNLTIDEINYCFDFVLQIALK